MAHYNTPWFERVDPLPTPSWVSGSVCPEEHRLRLANRYRAAVIAYMAHLFRREREAGSADEADRMATAVYEHHVRPEVLRQLGEPQDYATVPFRDRLLGWVTDGHLDYLIKTAGVRDGYDPDPAEFHRTVDAAEFRRAAEEFKLLNHRHWQLWDFLRGREAEWGRQDEEREAFNAAHGLDWSSSQYRTYRTRALNQFGNLLLKHVRVSLQCADRGREQEAFERLGLIEHARQSSNLRKYFRLDRV